MTATLINGNSSGTFHLLYRIVPGLMRKDGKSFRRPGDFDAEYGVVEIFDFLEYTYAEYNSEMSVRLMSGKGPNVLGWMPDWKILQSGQFLDLYPYMEKDSEFHEEDY